MLPSNQTHIIPTLHPVVCLNRGENYWFNGCAAYVMECMGVPALDYSFFAGLTGDNFTQIYGKDVFWGDSATDYLVKEHGGSYIQALFAQIGYACTYCSNRELQKDPIAARAQLKAFIDKGIPVIRYHWFWTVIVGYADDGETLLVLQEEQSEPERISFAAAFALSDPSSDQEAEDYGYGWFFVGDKCKEVSERDCYRTAVQNILPRLCIDRPHYCFGAEAFRQWAATLERGAFDHLQPETFDDWTLHTCYVCNLATNSGCGRAFLTQAMACNPDLEFLADVMRIYRRTGDLWNSQGGEDLQAIGGGFGVTLETLQDPQKRAKIVAKLLDFAHCTEQIIALFRANTDKSGKLAPIVQNLSDDTNVQAFRTVNTTDWVKSPNVPKFSGKIVEDKDASGTPCSCWRIDSRGGKWSTLYSTVSPVRAGDTIRLLFWAKFAEAGSHELILWVSQSDWSQHVECFLQERKPYLLYKKGAYCLMTMLYTARTDETVHYSLSANDVIVSLYPATKEELHMDSPNEVQTPQTWRIVNCLRQPFPACKFVGKCYKNSDRVDGMYSYHWEQWHKNRWFEPLERCLTDSFRQAYPDCDAYVGLMKNKDGAPDDYFSYWIGMFLPADCVVPDGYASVDIAHNAAGICWIQGQEDALYCHEGECYQELVRHGMTIPAEADGGCFMFERYCCPRISAPNAQGEVILDLGFFVEAAPPVQSISALRYSDKKPDQLEYFLLPDAVVIGKSFRCPLDKSVPNPVPAFWDECAADGSLATIHALPKLFAGIVGFTDDYDAQTNTFLYTVGAICKQGTAIPTGFTHRDIPETIVSKGKYGQWLDDCKPIWAVDDYAWSGTDGQFWNAELYLDGENTEHFRLLCAVMRP